MLAFEYVGGPPHRFVAKPQPGDGVADLQMDDLYGSLLGSWSPVLLAVGVVVVAFLIGRWWALLLALAVPLASPLYGEDSDGAPRWFWPTVMLGPPLVVALALGVGARKLAVRRRPRSQMA